MTNWPGTPITIKVKKGDTKSFCTCGLSKIAPFCDGAHTTTDKLPNVVTYDEDKTISACGCLKSDDLPNCDGSHNF